MNVRRKRLSFQNPFRLTSDASENWDGWYVDDIRLMGFSGGIVGIAGNNNVPFYKLEQISRIPLIRLP
jgi:hypothetical protein